MPELDELLNQGLAHHQAGRLQEAERLYHEVLQADPKHVEALHLMGLVHHKKGNAGAALKNLREALAIRPDSDVIWANLGAVYCALDRHVEAADAASHAIRLNPNNCMAHANLGANLCEQGKLDEAVRSCEQALAIDPKYAMAHLNLGVALFKQGKQDAAIDSYRKALAINPGYAEAHRHLGVVLREQGKLDQAVQSYQSALTVDPNAAEAHLNLARALLQQGNFETGWAEYEWRWQTKNKKFEPRNFSQPLWDGRAVKGKSLLLHAEQGLGDTIQFVRYAPLVRKQGCRIILECQSSLAALLTACPGVDELVRRGDELPPFDFHIPLLSLPHRLGTHLGNIPADVPYLFSREDLVSRWRERLRDCTGFKIGICWQGPPTYDDDANRSFTVAHFAAVAEIPGVHLISLQKGVSSEQLADLSFAIKSPGAGFDEGYGAFMDTAAVMRNLDLVITSDSIIAHLAGALAVPVWVALPKVADWRWLMDRDDSPWYPTMRLFRQDKTGDWEGVFQRIAANLHERVGTLRKS
jgi:Tfp pilus assembly protein PilF